MDIKDLNAKLAKNITLMGANEFFAALRFFYPISILYFAEVTGSFAVAMGIFACATIVGALLEVPTGVLSDKWGRRNIFVLGCVIEWLAAFCYAMAATHFLIGGTAWLYIGAACFGTSRSLFSGNNYALLYETAECLRQRHRLAHILGRNGSMEQLGLATASAVAGILLWFGGSFEMLFWLTLIPMSCALIAALMTTEPPRHSMSESHPWAHMKDAFHLIVQNRELRLLAICSAWKTGWGMSSHNFLPKFIETLWPVWAVPFYRLGQNIIGFFGYWFAGKVTDKLSPLKTLFCLSFISDGLSLIAFGISNLVSPFLLMLSQINWTVGNTANDTLQQQHFSKEQRSTMGSLISLLSSMTYAIAAVILGLFADHIGVQNTLLVIAVIMLPVTFGYLSLYKTNKNAK
ncbi:MAG: MFS transporter [Alphaproteobacteria bacterium]|nr:MFS transporter [Alphaproteobacteria bacterium]